MRKIQLFFAFTFIGLIVFMVVREFKRAKKLHKANIAGRIISIDKELKGYYDIKLVQNNKIHVISFSPPENELLVNVGDSIYKASNSNFVYIKKKENATLIKVEWKDIHIGGVWEK